MVPYVFFLCFSKVEDKLSLALASPIVVALVYGMFYAMFVLFRKNPFASSKILDIYTIIVLILMPIAYLAMLRYFILDFPNGYNLSMSITAVAFMAVIHTLKRRYK